MIYGHDSAPCLNGAGMWRDYSVRHGTVAARVLCRRYLKMQEDTPDASEREFCRELRAAMDFAPDMTGVAAYPYPHDENSVHADRVCANAIADAMRACELGDGSYWNGEALDALIEHFGFERVCFVLARELQADPDCPEKLRQWATSMNVRGDGVKPGVMLRPGALSGLASELLNRKELLAAHGIPHGKRGKASANHSSLLARLEDNKEKAARGKAARGGKETAKKHRETEVGG